MDIAQIIVTALGVQPVAREYVEEKRQKNQ